MHDLGQCEAKHGLRVELVNLYNSEAGNPQLPEKIRRTRRKRIANSALVLSSAGILGLAVLGTSWFVTAHFQKPNDAGLKRRSCNHAGSYSNSASHEYAGYHFGKYNVQ